MKKTILLFTLMASTFMFSQIEKVTVTTDKCTSIASIKPMGVLYIENEKCGEDRYRITYRDVKFTHINDYKSFDFKDIDNAYQNLFEMIIKGYDNPPKEDIMLNLPNDIIWLHFDKALGMTTFNFLHAENKNVSIIGRSQSLSKKQFLKLFGKK